MLSGADPEGVRRALQQRYGFTDLQGPGRAEVVSLSWDIHASRTEACRAFGSEPVGVLASHAERPGVLGFPVSPVIAAVAVAVPILDPDLGFSLLEVQ